MKKSLFLILLLTVSVSSLKVFSQEQPVYPKKFHIENNAVVDDAKKPFIFKGISIRDPVAMHTGNASFQNECVPLDEKLFTNIKSWGANIVRLPVLPFTWKLQGKNNTLKALDIAVELAAKNNMYVMITYQAAGWPSTDNPSDKSARTTTEELYGFWNEVSKHFKGNRTVVMYELFSEPVTKEFMKITEKDWVEWTDVMAQLTESVQRIDPDAICLISGLSWAHDISFVAGYPINRKNVGYSVHPYPFDSQLTTIKNLKIVSSVAKKYFVFVTEVGYDFELFANMTDVQRKLIEIYPEIKPQMDEVRRLRGNKLYYSDLNKKLFDTLIANDRAAAYLKEIVENYQKELKKTFDAGNISWAAWCMSYSWRPCLLKDKDFTPTDSGEFFRNWLQGKK
ncbi:MAG TPA: hypothetical protein DCZ94_00910 [Lentisphaeria bacterium]|nr:MAG: hypothetical protein A2X48_11860 [Lentisphaerae bacterium GWF2_49_21]HBC85490.1 hypothetical protein [Lentisphaeria bacterium]